MPETATLGPLQQEAKDRILAFCRTLDRQDGRIKATYSGSGDEGSMQDFLICGDTDNDPGEPLDAPNNIKDDFEVLAWGNVTGDNEGGGGEIVVDLATMTVTRSEYAYVTETEDLGTETL